MSIVTVISGWLNGATTSSQGGPAKLDGPQDRSWQWGTGPTFAKKRVTPDSTLSLSTAWACTRLNGRTIGSLPRKLHRRGSGGVTTPAENHPLSQVLLNPNPDQTAMEHWEGQAVALNLRGNAYARIGRRGDGNVVALWPISPDACSPYRATDGTRRYRVTTGGNGEDLPESEIFHLRGFGAGGDQGLSPIAFGRQTIATALAAEEVAGSTFANGLQVAGFVQQAVGAKFTPDQMDQLIEMFERFSGSSKAGKVMPLHPGMEFKPLTMSPEDAQLLETRRFSVEEICRWFGVFPILIGHAAQGQTMWGSGIEQIVLAWLTLGLGTELERIEQAIEKQLLLPADRGLYKVETSVEGLLRADSAARAALYSSLGQNGVATRNWMRAKENMAPDAGPNADKLTVQSSMILLDDLGQLGVAGQPADQMRSAMANLMFGGDIEAVIDARVKAALLGHNGGPRLED